MVNLPNYMSLVGLVVGWAWFLGCLHAAQGTGRTGPSARRARRGIRSVLRKPCLPFFPTLTPYKDFTPAAWSMQNMKRNREYWMVIGLLGVSAYLLWRALNG